MSHPKPFQAKNVRYDSEGNIVILALKTVPTLSSSEAAQSGAAESRGISIPSFHSLLAAARSSVEKSSRTLTRTLHSVRFPDCRGVLQYAPRIPKFSSVRGRLDRIRSHPDKRVRLLFSGAQFAARFTAIFLFLFVSLNARSYFQVARANLLPDSGRAERRALQVMTDPLLAVPELPRAGKPSDMLAMNLEVTPPDDRLIIPKIGKNVPLISVSDAALKREDWKTFEKDIQDALLLGAVRYPGTALPGQVGNVFVTGHSSNYPWILSDYNAVLALLPKLEIGDEYSLYHAGELHRYRISKKFEVSPKDISVLEQPTDRRMSTLMTCSPIGTTLRRLILQADEVDPVTGSVIAVTEEERLSSAPKWSAEMPI